MQVHSPLGRLFAGDRSPQSVTPAARRQTSPLRAGGTPNGSSLQSYLSVRRLESRSNCRSPKPAISPLHGGNLSTADLLDTSTVMKLIHQSHGLESTYGSLLRHKKVATVRPVTAVQVHCEKQQKEKKEKEFSVKRLKRGLSWLCTTPNLREDAVPFRCRRVCLKTRKSTRKDLCGLTVAAKSINTHARPRTPLSISRLEQTYATRERRSRLNRSASGHYSSAKVDQYAECCLDDLELCEPS